MIEKKSKQSRSVAAALNISFPPSDLTVSFMKSFHSVKSKGRTGCQLVLPLPRCCKKQRETPGGARTNLMGKRLYRNQMHAASRSSRWIRLSREHPAFHPRPMYYNVQLRELLSLLQAFFPYTLNSPIFPSMAVRPGALNIPIFEQACQNTRYSQFAAMYQLCQVTYGTFAI